MALFLALCLCLLASCSATGWRRELTTRSYDSLGFHENIYHSPAEDQIIIAVLDSGIWPESLSFRDEGLGPPPAKWKGICQTGNSYIPFKCNNKIIGARMYFGNPSNLPEGEELSPRDMDGHGTHCAATVAGVLVRNVSVQGVGQGTARGAVPRARIAVYKVCWMQYCMGNAKAMKDALHDGVDIITISNAANGGLPYMNNEEARISFEATILGVLVSYGAANNSTLEPYTVSNSYPWVVTVANSAGSGTNFVTYVTLGDGKRFEGTFLNTKNDTMYSPLVRIEEVTNATDPDLVSTCANAFVKPELVKGKIIICPSISDSPWDWNFDYLGCAGLIINGEPDKYFFDGVKDNIYFHNTSRAIVTLLRSHDFEYMQQYYNKSISIGRNATALIEKTVPVPDTAPHTVIPSSRGPSLSDINILKPDISAPGVNQIDAVTGRRNLAYDLKTGTSMSTPFLAGVAAYLKSLHPTWSASAIKSALMTTASPMTDDYSYAGPLAYGSGQVSPLKAADPGLVYDIGETDYVKYFCQYANFSSEWVNKFRRRDGYDCAKFTDKGWTLNYPSFAVPVVPNQPFVSVFKRTLTNVANLSISNYKVIVSAPRELTVKIDPSVLAFTQVGQALSYTLNVSGQLDKSGKEITIPNLVATVVWTDGIHQVRSPISVFEAPADYNAQFLKTHGVAVEDIFQGLEA